MDGHGHAHGGGDLDNFLVLALDEAVSLVEVDDLAVAIAKDWDIELLGARDEFFSKKL